MTFGTFFLPGPTEVRDEVLREMLRPMIAHRGAEFETLFATVQQGLQQVFGTTRPVYISTSSATGLMEAGVRCAPDGRVLSLVNGAFSERFANIATACGRTIDRYDVEWGGTHDPDALDTLLHTTQYSALTVVHSETSTGALNDVQAIAQVARRHDVVALVDSVSGIGGAELRFDEWELDYALTGSQKALALPPGLAFAVASESFIAGARAAQRKGVYFDLVEHEQYAQKQQVPNTPAISLYYALERQLEDIVHEGLAARWDRHARMAEQMQSWVDTLHSSLGDKMRGLQILAAEGHRSPTVSALVLPSSVRGEQLVEAVARRGFTIGSGYGKLKDTTVRIGHMGDHTESGLRACLGACAEALQAVASTADAGAYPAR